MSASSSNVTSPSNSSRPSTTSFVKSPSNRSIFRSDKPLSRSRQNTVGLDFTDDLVRNIGSDYQEIQVRTLTKWVNAQLKPVDESIKDLKTDLRDGKKLLKLLSVVSKEPAPKPERMNMRIHQLSNVAQALAFLERQVGHESMPDIGNEAIVNGDAKKILSLIFFIMLKYQIQLIVSENGGDDFLHSLSELSKRENGVTMEFNIEQPRKLNDKSQQHTTTSADAKVALLYWVRIQLEDYITANIIPSIQDFSRSWKNGVAFCLLIHRYDPTFIPDLFSVYLNNPDLTEKSTWLHLLKLAFRVATEQMGVQPYLEPEDLVEVEYPHEPSVMMYVSEYYKVMSKYQRDEPLNIKQERAAKRRAEIIIVSGGTSHDEEEQIIHPTLESMTNSPTSSEASLGQQLQPPTPIPMPSARRKIKMAQRESTLKKEDKERIKADLNSKLLMQLTGHLPRGIHPILDELLTIHETVLSFIKSNTQTIDEIPEEFTVSTSVSEYIDALEIIEEQVDNESIHLETAKHARDVLTSPPETADDTLIRLTDLQRTQVSKLYDMLMKEWDQFEDLLKTTKDDLLTVENALMDTEEGAEEYIQRSIEMEKELDMYALSLKKIAPENKESVKLHSMEGTLELAEQYKSRLAEYMDQFKVFQNTVWADFTKASRHLSRAVMQVVSMRSNLVISKYDTLVINLEYERQACANFERGLKFLDKVKEIEAELTQIQVMMEENGQQETTNDDIQQLETKVAAVRATVHITKETFGDLITADDKLEELFSQLQSRYQVVNQWVDQVRVWFLEAERIRNWIEVRIQTIDQSNNDQEIDPLLQDMSYWEESVTAKVYDDHSKLKREIERFDQDDMARLRSHVKALTHDSEKNLSPADASTIEITLTTLNILNKLMSLLRKRSQLVEALRVRIKWEEILEKAILWCIAKDTELDAFVNGKARWEEPEEDEISVHQLKLVAEDVIQTLLAIETSIAEFDKGDYSAVLDTYQELEDLRDSDLPSYLEKRQDELENDFEKLMKRCSFVRKVVEQHLVVNDVAIQFRKLRVEGEKIKSSMAHGTDDDSFNKRVHSFKENSSNWVTVLVKRIPYPEIDTEVDEVNNAKANANIRKRMNEYATYLAEITEELETLLASHRENLSLQQRASLAYDDLLRITSWIEERMRALEKFDTSILEGENIIVLQDETIVRLEKEHDGIAARMEQLEKQDMKRSLETVRRLEVEIDKTNSVSVDRNTLINGIERLEMSQHALKEALAQRERELTVVKKRITWESLWEDADIAMTDLARHLWDFNDRYAQYDTEGLKKKRSSSTSHDPSEINKRERLIQLDNDVNQIATSHAILASDTEYNQMKEAYVHLPTHLEFKQSNIKQRHEDLKLLSSYVLQILEQQEEVAELADLSAQVLSEGGLAQETVQNTLREASTSSSSISSSNNGTSPELGAELISQIEGIKDQVGLLCETGKNLVYLTGGNWFEDCQTESETTPAVYNAQLKAFVDKKLDALTRLKDSLSTILDRYRYASSVNQKLDLYRTEANSIVDWTEKATETLNGLQLDVSSASDLNFSQDTITDHETRTTELVSEVKKLESGRIRSLQKSLDDLLLQISQDSPSILQETTDACNVLKESINRSILSFYQAVTNQNLVLDASRKRLAWETSIEDAQGRLDFMQHQLQQYILKKNKCVAQQEILNKEHILELEQERSNIEDQCTQFIQDKMKALEFQFEQAKLLFVKLPLTKAIPVHMQERTESLERNLSKLQKALTWRSKELEYIQQRFGIEMDMKQAMQDLNQLRKSVSIFVEEKGRWHPNDMHPEVENQWQKEKSSFELYQKHTLAPIKEMYLSLNEISSSLKPGFLSEIHAKKYDALLQLENNVDADITFAFNIISQRKQILDFLGQANDFEKLAETMKENFLTADSNADLNEKQTEQLDHLRAQLDTLCQFAKHGILVPKRSNENDIAIPTKVKDKTMNSVTQDVIDTKMNRLEELVESLSTLFKSQEVFTRLQYVLKIFKKQMITCENWLSSRQKVLERNIHILDDDHLSLDVDHLRDAVSEADSIQTAMVAQDNHFTSLTKHRTAYITTFDEQSLLSDKEKEDVMVEFDEVSYAFEKVSRQWHDLLLETKEVSTALSSALLPAELNGRVIHLLESFNSLQSQIKAQEDTSVTDDQISDWQERIDHLEYKEYDRLYSEIMEYKQSMSVDMIDSLTSKLDGAGDTVLEIRAALTSLYDLMNASRLRNTHAENSKLFHDSAEKMMTSIETLEQSHFKCITDKKTEEERILQTKELTTAHKQIKEAMLECQGYYDDSCSYYSGMKVQDVITPDSETVQTRVQSTWKHVQDCNSGLSAFVTRNSRWMEGLDTLDKLYQSSETLKTDVDKFSAVQHVTTTSTQAKIQEFEKKLLQIIMNREELENTIKMTPDMDNDDSNKRHYLKRCQTVRDLAQVIQANLSKKRMDRERLALYNVYKNEIAKVLKVCEDQIAYIRQQSNATPEHHLKKAETINSVIQAYGVALSHISDNYSECKIKYDGIISDQATKLVKTFDHPTLEVNEAKSTLEKSMKELHGALKIENDYITSLKLLSRIMKSEKELSRGITDLKSNGSRPYTGKSARTSRTRDLPELKDYMQRFETLEGNIQEFQKKCEDLKKNINKNISQARVTAITKSVDRRKDEMNRRWTEIKSTADGTRERLDTLYKRQTASSKLTESLKYAASLRDRIEVLQLSGHSVVIEEQELNELQGEISVTLKKYTSDIDELLAGLSKSDLTASISEGTLKSQREKLSKLTQELYQLVEHRLKQAHTEGSITEFFDITAQIDAEIMMLAKVIEQTSTQHASVVGSKFNKADLQQLLKTLIGSYKKGEARITPLITKVKSEAQKQFLDDNERVANRFRDTMKDWDNLQSSYSSREKELQTCIKELNHEFFTKLAMAKSAPRERRTRRTSKSKHDATPGSGPRQFSFRSSTLSTEMKMTSPPVVRRSKTPASSGRNTTNYVADPKNELDVQLGLIVNESPFRVKVKKVQGEVGKYWFGEEHPRLVYCRILPSKMVMVRVGGGWAELSKFMKDHGHSDNLATKSDKGETHYITVNTLHDEDLPSFSVTTRSGSPMGPIVGTPIIRRGSGVSSSLTNHSSNSSTGYVEGDKYIHVDDEGNQFTSKMVRADSNTSASNASSNKK